jgi:hypothetical protein
VGSVHYWPLPLLLADETLDQPASIGILYSDIRKGGIQDARDAAPRLRGQHLEDGRERADHRFRDSASFHRRLLLMGQICLVGL